MVRTSDSCDQHPHGSRQNVGTNRRSATTKWSSSAFERFGVDTAALRFHRLGGSECAAVLSAVPSLPSGRGRQLLTSHPSGARVHWYPDHGTVKVECRLAALLDCDRDSARLASRHELATLPDAAAATLAEVLELAGAGRDELRRHPHSQARLDLTGDLRFPTATEGLSFLMAAKGLRPPGYKEQSISFDDGFPETVYTITAKRARKVARFYDCGLKHGTAPRGELIRYEVQHRFASARRVSPTGLARTPYELPDLFARHLGHFTNRAKEMTIASAQEAPAQIARLLAEGSITRRQANGLAGFVAMLPHGGRHLYGDRASRRYLRELRRHGVLLSASEQDHALTIGQALDALLEGVAAECGVDG